MPPTDMEIRTAKPGARIVKLSDGGGLQLWIMPDGAKRWRFAYRLARLQKLLAVGVYAATAQAGRAYPDEAILAGRPRDRPQIGLRRFPERLNNEKRAFAKFLDDDNTGTVKWWLKNAESEVWATRLLLPTARRFFPDFIVRWSKISA